MNGQNMKGEQFLYQSWKYESSFVLKLIQSTKHDAIYLN